ncbi:DUF4355 domain-containing protein [Pediococcus acidilactici]|uniref:DUF4355 domain-containing protein n=1 Tax=Pediococcus acidilactici TaxID=1254 RepID=UPI002AFFCCC6|nr:DUF4355 domain-containing protein [Pediococcus acidilactici]WQS10516.1 DUF4355 domain-containing protein [Pediococcus acidilactici]
MEETVLPMDLQFFAEDPAPADPVDPSDNHNDNPDASAGNTDADSQNGKSDDSNGDGDGEETDKTVEKLQKRLHAETANKHSLEEQVTDLQKQIEDLTKKSDKPKNITKLSEEDKKNKALEEAQKRNAELEAQLKRNEVLSQTRSVLQEDGINVNDDILGMIVADDDEKTYKNIVAIKNLIQSTTDTARKGFLQGSTPKDTGSQVTDAFAAKLNKYK